MRSQLGFLAALVLLLALPITVLYQVLFGAGADTVVHVMLATGSLLLAASVFDFSRMTKWITWLGCLAAAAEGTIFLLQGLSHLVQNAAFTELVYQGLGQWPERLFMDLIIIWLVVLWLTDSQGRTRILGLITLVSVVGLEVYSCYLLSVDSSINTAAPALKLLYLLPFVWLLLESNKRIGPVRSHKLTIQPKETV
ncbi:MAG TPA: hypothetical protein VK897_16595 [Anaerolineales bacterium]|nr:hypothetical protein [Anaerolineales bacterium]